MNHKRMVVSFSVIVVLAILLIVSASWAFTKSPDTAIDADLLYQVSASRDLDAGWTAAQDVWCELGDTVVSGGFSVSPWGNMDYKMLTSHPNGERSWRAGGSNYGSITIEITTYAICLDQSLDTYLPEIRN